MADYTWPATLPQKPLVDSIEEQPPDTVVRTEMDAGPAKIRQRVSDNVRPIEFEMLMTTAQVTTLDDFFTSTLSGGASRFNWTHPRTDATEEFRFTDRPTYKPVGGDYWRVQIQLEEMP